MIIIKAGGGSEGQLTLNVETAQEADEIEREHSYLIIVSALSSTETIPWLRPQADIEIVFNGVLPAGDAVLAVEACVDAIIVSNHGGRQLDAVSATLEALPEVSRAAKGCSPILFGGGVTKGSGLSQALASLGVDRCLLGRSALWDSAVNGQQGAETVLNILKRKLWRTIVLSGTAAIKDISSSMVGVRQFCAGFGIAKL